MDFLDPDDKYYDRKYKDMQIRMDNLYEEIDSIESEIAEIEAKINAIV